MTRSRRRLFLLVLPVAMALSGCGSTEAGRDAYSGPDLVSSPTPMPTNQAGGAGVDSSEESVPAPTARDRNEAAAACMRAKGLMVQEQQLPGEPPTLEVDGLLFGFERTGEMIMDCWREVERATWRTPTVEAAEALFDATYLRYECFVSHGFSPPPPPSRESFIDDYMRQGWALFDPSGDILTDHPYLLWEDIALICPCDEFFE